MKSLSFIIPAYNPSPAIYRLVEILRAEIEDALLNAEIVVVDDGSVEPVGDMEGATVIRQENCGVSSARNKGLDVATGRYVWFVDSDDEIVRGSLIVLKPILESPTAPDIVSFDFCEKSSERSSVEKHHMKEFNMDSMYDARYVMRCFGGVLWAWNGIFKRSAISGLRFRNYRNGEDTLWGYEALLSVRTFGRIDKPLYVYRDNVDGASRKFTKQHLESIMDVAAELKRAFYRSGHWNWFQSQFMRHLDGMAKSGAMKVVRSLGHDGFCIWRRKALTLYCENEMLPLYARLWHRVVLAINSDWLVDVSFFKPIETKKYILGRLRKVQRHD